MTIRQAISQVRKPLRETTADSRLTNKSIYSALQAVTPLVIQRESDALRLSGSDVFQLYQCLHTEPVNAAGDNPIGLRSATILYRSSYPLPPMYEDRDGPIVRRITSLDNSRKLEWVTMDTVRRAKSDVNARYDKTVYAYPKDGYLYLTHPVPVAFYGYFKEQLPGTGDPCTPFLDQQWYVPQKLQQAILDEVVKGLLQSYKQLQEQQVIDKNQNT